MTPMHNRILHVVTVMVPSPTMTSKLKTSVKTMLFQEIRVPCVDDAKRKRKQQQMEGSIAAQTSDVLTKRSNREEGFSMLAIFAIG